MKPGTQFTLAMVLPTVATLALGIWSFGFAAFDAFIQKNGSFSETVGFLHSTVVMLGIRAGTWILLGWGCYSLGFLLLFSSMRNPKLRGARTGGLLLAHAPLVIIGLAFVFAEYRGP